ncbi:MAG: hypothetical protein ABIF40_02815 [archaeon]
MPIVGFNFDKIDAEKKRPVEPPVNVNTGVVVKDMKEEKLPVGKSETVLRVDFEFTVKYEPGIADILLGGHLLYLDESKKAKDILNTWKKDKKLGHDVMQVIMNTILIKSNVKALMISQELNLPPHVKLPTIQSQPIKKSKADLMVS